MTLHLGNLSTGRRVSEQSCGCGGPRNTCDNRRITAIVRDKDNVMVMFDDCTFMKASFDVVSDSVKRTITADGTDLTPLLTRLEALEEKPDNDTIFDPTALEERLTALEAFKSCVCDGMERIDSLSGKKSFVAFKPDFVCCEDDPTPPPEGGGGETATTSTATVTPTVLKDGMSKQEFASRVSKDLGEVVTEDQITETDFGYSFVKNHPGGIFGAPYGTITFRYDRDSDHYNYIDDTVTVY